MGVALNDDVCVRRDRHPRKSMVNKQGFVVCTKRQSEVMAGKKGGFVTVAINIINGFVCRFEIMADGLRLKIRMTGIAVPGIKEVTGNQQDI